MSPPGRQPTTAAVRTTARVSEVVQKARYQEGREKSRISDGRSANTSAFAHLPTLRRDVLVRAAVRRSSTLGSRMGQKQTLAPMIDSGVMRSANLAHYQDETAYGSDCQV